ncbi:MAG: Spermidine N(1)-acetyltransferase [Bacteroidota bacterium]|jgi:glycosyltransferase involved in cell wall biosynthesis/RimJ/RimL family protein N-acetyltransferase
MKVQIRPLESHDAYISYKWRNDKDVFKYTGTTYDNEITLDMELEWIQRVINNKNEYRCAILVDDVYVGNIYLTDIESSSAIYHIFIGDKNYYKKGIAYKASKLIIDYAKEELKLSIIYLTVRQENLAAINLYKKLGFVISGINGNSLTMQYNMNAMRDTKLVSVFMLAYNHENFIKQAIEGIVTQKTNFSFELIIGEDCSTDNTRNLCIEYRNKYPEIIKLILPEKNLGAAANSVNVLNACKGKYIAFCEGDDYWTDPNKLQKQVDFMESNPDYSIIYHRVNIFDQVSETLKLEELNKLDVEKTYTIENLSYGNLMHTASVMIRRENLKFEKLEASKIVGDYFLWMLCANNGKIMYQPDVMAVYRIWEGSAWSSMHSKFMGINWLSLLDILRLEFATNQDILLGFLEQEKRAYKMIYEAHYRENDLNSIDLLTKRLLLSSSFFRNWWFRHMSEIESDKMYRLKYFLFLMRKGKFSSLRLIKKCFT